MSAFGGRADMAACPPYSINLLFCESNSSEPPTRRPSALWHRRRLLMMLPIPLFNKLIDGQIEDGARAERAFF